MIDTDLLADVYIELIGGKQPGLRFPDRTAATVTATTAASPRTAKPARATPPCTQPHEAEAHKAFVATLKDPLWDKINSS